MRSERENHSPIGAPRFPGFIGPIGDQGLPAAARSVRCHHLGGWQSAMQSRRAQKRRPLSRQSIPEQEMQRTTRNTARSHICAPPFFSRASAIQITAPVSVGRHVEFVHACWLDAAARALSSERWNSVA